MHCTFLCTFPTPARLPVCTVQNPLSHLQFRFPDCADEFLLKVSATQPPGCIVRDPNLATVPSKATPPPPPPQRRLLARKPR